MLDLYAFAKPFVHALDPEKAHTLTIRMLKTGITGLTHPPRRYSRLKTEIFGLSFDNPVGLAAGFDKDAEVMSGAQRMGFGFVEAGSVTPKPQSGNDKPRLFRLTADKAVINRFGFNNKGLDAFANRLERFKPPYGKSRSVVGANVGANKDATDRTADYETCIDRLYGLSDYFTVNISSPNTPGLRALQSRETLEDLVNRVLAVRARKMGDGARRIPILVKIAPDLTEDDVSDIAAVALGSDIDGLIVSNTTIERPDSLKSHDKGEAGGLSGKPLFEPSTKMLARMFEATEGKIPLVGVGGISSGTDAYAKIRAGASLVQLYSALVFEGPGLVERVKRELNSMLEKDGFETVADAVGADHR